MTVKREFIPPEEIHNKSIMIRGKRVTLDFQFAGLHGVPTKSLNLAVRRNKTRCPGDFIFQLNATENKQLPTALRFQNETSNKPRRGGRRYSPYAFTEQGGGYAFKLPAQ